jgi:predicted PhzF superfamily epimerase YddE/YHI9
VKHGLVAPDSARAAIVFLQGVQERRPSRIHVRIATSGDREISSVKVAGTAVVVGEGTMALPGD